MGGGWLLLPTPLTAPSTLRFYYTVYCDRLGYSTTVDARARSVVYIVEDMRLLCYIQNVEFNKANINGSAGCPPRFEMLSLMTLNEVG